MKQSKSLNGKTAGLDDINTELLKQLRSHVWRKAKTIAILIPGKSSQEPKNFRPISLQCFTFKLLERMIFNRLLPFIDEKLIPEQACFRPDWSYTGQILKLTQHIEDGFEKRMVTGAIFVDLSAAYDAINHRKLLHKLLEITKDSPLIKFKQTMLNNWRSFVIRNGKRSKWRNQKNVHPRVVF